MIKEISNGMNPVVRKKHTLDAQGKILGRIATEIAFLLRGKGKLGFAPHLDIGDFVTVKNAKQIRYTGRKLKDKMYYRHSGYLGHLKSETLEKLLERRPQEVVRKAVMGMLPKNRLRALCIKRLKIEQ